MNEENQDQLDKDSIEKVSPAEKARQICEKILSFFPLDSTPRIQAWQDKGKVFLEIYGDKSGILIGKHGQTLSALEWILNRLLQSQTGTQIELCLDCEGYRKRRKETLERIARNTAQEVSITKKPVNLGPMTSEERKIIHIALRDHPLVCTESRGNPPIKEILIKPRDSQNQKPENKKQEPN